MEVQELHVLKGGVESPSVSLPRSDRSELISTLPDQESSNQLTGENEGVENDIEEGFDRPSNTEEHDEEDNEYILPSDNWEEEEWEEIWNPNWDDDDWINDFDYAEEAPKLIET